MSDPCNFSKAQQAQFVPSLIAAPCAPSHPSPITTMDSDWNDIGTVVDHLRALRGVGKVSIGGWWQGGPRGAGYGARNPAKVARLVMLAPAYTRASPLEAPNPLPPSSGPMTAQSQADFKANWDRQVGCPEQYEPAASAAVWADMLVSDPVGAAWGTGVRRAPQGPTWGFNQAVVARMQTPFLLETGAHDKQVAPERVRDLYADLGSKQKVIIDLACSSHNAMWERNRLLLFKDSLEGLQDGKASDVTPEALRRIAEDDARSHMVIAFDLNGEELSVAMADPRDERTLEELSRLTGLRISPFLASSDSIKRAQLLYRGDLLELLKHAAATGAPVSAGAVTAATARDLLTRLLEYAVVTGTSDVHIEPYE